MRKLIFVLTLVSFLWIPGLSKAGEPAHPAPQFAVDNDGNLLSDTYPAPVKFPATPTVALTRGAATSTPLITDEHGAPVGSTTIITIGAATQEITALSNRRKFRIVASGVFQPYVGTTTVVASGADMTDTGWMEYGSAVPAAVGTNATPTTGSIFQSGE